MKINVLYVDPYISTQREIDYPYYGGLFHELKKICNVELTNKLFDDFSKVESDSKINYDIVIFGLSYFEKFQFFKKIKNLDLPSIVHLFKPQNNLDEKLLFCKKNKINQIVTPLPMYNEIEERTGIPCTLLPYGYDPTIFKSRLRIKFYDIGFSGMLHQNIHYPKDAFDVIDLRKSLGEILKNYKEIKLLWKGSDTLSQGRIKSVDSYAKSINTCKVWLATPAAYQDITPRYFEIMGSKTLLMCSRIPEAYKDLLVHQSNCIEFKNDLSDFEKKLNNILSKNELRKTIIKKAIKDAQELHTWKKRALNFKSIIKKILN